MFNDSTVWNSDVRQSLKNIRISNIRAANYQLYKNKFDLSCEQIKGLIDVLIVPETKLAHSFPEG